MQKSTEEVDVDVEAPIEDRRAALVNELGLSVTDSAMEHDIIGEQNILEAAEAVELQYVDDSGVPVPEIAEEVIMEGEYVEDYLDPEHLHEDDMAESLVALSRSGEFCHKSGREYVVENMESRRRHPRILRRFGSTSHQQYMDQHHGFVDPSQIVVEEFHPVSSAGRDTRFTPRYPVAVAKRGPTANVRNSFNKTDWREDQCKCDLCFIIMIIKLLVCDVLESLPEHKQESFKRLMEILGISVPGYRESSRRRYPGISPVESSFFIFFVFISVIVFIK
uniref:Uncharacterized protein n=1 Tax=Angiostrongylus cantonensis TaxID=6313 RepID=A0A0K0D3D7_ANGCA